ncbi:rho guanine nucleotide exchange factor 17 [Carettochelys insculpta]|uniref:rho guanine nucleotide exchange factor 17 n=1 Tax=Carettochelys insculpta TaxID=44489 RepID=UPI003EB7C302
MAEGEAGGRAPLRRSGSFQLLERWLGAGASGRPRQPPCQRQPPGARAQQPDSPPRRRRSPCTAACSSGLARKVSKLAAAAAGPSPPARGRALRSLSPSVRQLSRRFDAAAPPGSPSEEEPDEDGATCCPPPPGKREARPAAHAEGGGPPRSPALSESPKAGEAGLEPGGLWPSVTEMRKLFGGARSAGPEEERLRAGPKPPPPPPPPPPRSCIPHPGLLRAPAEARRQQQQQQPPPWDTSHSWHSCSQPQAACLPPAPSSSRQDPLPAPSLPCPRAHSPSPGPLERSSGSEEEEGTHLVAPRKRSVRKKKRDPGLWDHESDSEGLTGMEAPPGWPWRTAEGLGHRPPPAKEGVKRLVDGHSEHVWPGLLGETKAAGGAEGHRQYVRGMSEGATAASFLLGAAPAVPLVARVSKVHIPPFGPSPGGSRSSSRYSSTETLKEEEHFGPCWLGQSQNLQGSLSLYRSPSFGQSEGLARLQQQVQVRPKLPVGISKAKQDPLGEVLLQCGSEAERAKHRKSMSNPDIATETLTLLSFLKSDLSELKVRRKSSGGSDQEEGAFGGGRSESHQSPTRPPMGGRGRSVAQAPNRWVLGSRPTLKDLTATLRRAKSFTYSDKPAPRRLFLQSSMKQSSSELLLASSSDCDSVVSDGDMGQRGEAEGLPVVIQDQYIQEARQVFEKIRRIGAQQDDGFASEQKDSAGVKGVVECAESQKEANMALLGSKEQEECLKKAESEENLSCRKSMEELSGHESSMTDEGIVTEPEMGLTGAAYGDLAQAVTAWTPTNAGVRESDADRVNGKELPLSGLAARMNHEGATVDDALPSKAVAQGSLETPLTPSTQRRRRKFPSVGNNGSDSTNGESSGEPYRSLSDPIPHRRCSITEETENFSVDSNLLGSLNSKAGVPEPFAMALSECTGSAASDLSVCSDGVKDYNTLIQNIVSQPGAMDKVIDERGNGKTVKKKSFSDPSRRGELASSGFEGPSEPITEMDQTILPSSSEPILSEQRDEVGELEEPNQEVVKLGSQSEHILPAQPGGNIAGEATPGYSFDPKLAEVLPPRIIRRNSRKHTNRVSHQDTHEAASFATISATSVSRLRPISKHERHTSETSAFLPLSAPESPELLNQNVHVTVPESSPVPIKSYPVLQAPSLEDVTKQYMLTLNSVDSSSSGTVDMPRSSPATPTTSEPKLLRCPKQQEEHNPSSTKNKPQVDMRKHVTMTLLDTEQSYVESLRTLMQGYMKPLKQPENSTLCDPSLVDEMFDQIPELLEHHEQFLEQVHNCVQNWHEKQKVGDVLVQSFSKDILVNIYSAYIDNFLNARDAVRIAKEARPAFMKFLEQSMRENKEKQALSDLMIKPVQRIPRYELLVKDLLKHTPEDHPDHPFLLDAQRNIKQVAEKINKGMKSAEEVERNARILQEIESHIEGMEDLQAPLRRFLRQEMVVEVKAVGGKKERSLFLFTDLLICTTLKRKSGSLRRSSMSLYTAASVIDTASKYKLLWKLPLEDVDVVKGASQSTNRESIQKTICRLDEDLSTLGQVSKLSETLSFPHQSLDDVIKDLMAAIHRELAEKQSLSFAMSFPPNKVELTTTKADGTESFIFEFPNPDARHSFEQAFEDTKKKLASHKNCLDPEFLKAIPIMKTRSGMQFSCASPSHSSPENAYEVWVCNSDGYVGQVCLLSIKQEPTVEACIAVCSARILCIAAVPGLKRSYRERPESLVSPTSEPAPSALDDSGPQQCLHISISGSSIELSEPMDSANRELMPFDSDDTDDESSPSPSGTLQSQASHSTISSSFGNEEIPSSKDAAAETTSSEEEQEPGFLPISSTFGQNRNSESPMDGRALRRSSRGSFTRGSLEDLLSTDPEAYQSSMWLGTEDGCIHVYQSSDNIRNRKNSMKMQHSASVMCIVYLDNQVFVSLANGELIVYQREAGHFWDPQHSKSLSLGSPGSPVTKMVSVAGKLWCGCLNRVMILNTATLLQEHTFHIGQDSNRSVTCMVSCSPGVWLALQSSAQVRLYHATSYEQLAEVDITPLVHKMLAGSDAIIRQHKAACLRITALLACKDLLWIGTSAGVVLTLSIMANATSWKIPPTPVGLSQGHTGHVRFLTSIELPDGFDIIFPPLREPGTEKLSDTEKRDLTRHRSSNMVHSKSKMLVISGGDGYEDFRLTSSSETVGRDDSTNHLLLWRV